jgi:hypothetical protein
MAEETQAERYNRIQSGVAAKLEIKKQRELERIAKLRFVLNVGAIRETYPDMPEQNNGDIVLWDRQERKPVVTIHATYANAICLETTRSPKASPFTNLEDWFNSLSNDCLESEGLPVTR